jgi:hypothetical protein
VVGRHGNLLWGGSFFALFLSLSTFGSYDTPLLSDSQHYFFIAERAASGVPPHVSHFDPKNALSMLVSAGAMRVGRVVGVDDVTASRVVSIAAAALAIGLTWTVAQRITGSVTAAWVATAGMLSLYRFMFVAIMGSQPKILLVLFALLSLHFVSRERPVLSGLAAGAAFLCWQPAALLLAAGPIALWMGGRGVREAAVFLLSSLLPLVVYEGYYIQHGALAEQIEQAYRFPYHYMDSFPSSMRPVWRRARWVLSISRGIDHASIVPMLFLAWLGLLWAGWWRKRSFVASEARGRPDRWYLALAAHGALASCLVSYQGFPDRFLLDPLMAIAAGWMVSGAATIVGRRIGARRAHAVAVLGCVASLVVLGARGHWDFRSITGLGEQRRLGEAVGHLIEAGYSVYAVGCTHLLAFHHVDNYTPFGFFFRGVAEYLQVKTGGRGYVPLRDGKLPDVILVSRGKYVLDQPWFRQNYLRAKRDDFGRQSVQVWLRSRGEGETQSR